MYANVLPLESKKSLAEFHQIEALFAEFSEPMDSAVEERGEQSWPTANNHYSSKKFKMIKIIERVLVTTSSGRKGRGNKCVPSCLFVDPASALYQ